MPVFACNVCGAQLSAEDRYAGRKVRCPTCESIEIVPGAEDLAPVFAAPKTESGRSTESDTTSYEAPPETADHPDPRMDMKPRPKTAQAPNRLSAMTVRAHKGTGRRYGFNCQYCSSRLEANEGMA
ncbi:MAG: hypothetical protein AAF743_15265, partial [Planctomycetota bacterium]